MEGIIYTCSRNHNPDTYVPLQTYEQSYFSKINLNYIIFDEISTKEDIIDFISQINNIKPFFFKEYSVDVERKLSSKYLEKYVDTFKTEIENSLINFLKNGHLENYIFSFLKLNIFCDCCHLTILSENLKKIFEESDESYNFYEKLNSFFLKISFFDPNCHIKKKLIESLSHEIYFKVIFKLYEEISYDFFSELLNNNKYSIFFKKCKIFNYLKEEHKLLFFYKIFDYLETFNSKDLLDRLTLKKLINIVNIFNITFYELNLESQEKIKDYISKKDNLDNISSYFCASIYYLIKNIEYNLIFDIIKFNKFFVSDYIFLKSYNYHLQKRCENEINLKGETSSYEYIKLVYANSENKKLIDDIKYSIDDVKISKFLTDDLSKFNIKISSDEFKNLEIDINKLNLLITSNIKWGIFNVRNNVISCNEINAYKRIVEQYYKSKYKTRKMEISNDKSSIDIKLGNSYFRMNFIFYDILNLIGKGKDVSLNDLHEKTRINKNEIYSIINTFKNYDIIKEDNKIFSFNKDILKEKLNINFLQVKINLDSSEEKIINNVESYLLDCLIVKTCKHSSERSFSFKNLKDEISKIISEYNYKPLEDIFMTKRLDRLVTLEYISYIDNKYQYIL